MPQGKHNVCGTSRQVVSAPAGIVTLPKLLVYSFQERRNLHLYHENAQKSLSVHFLILKTAKYRQLFEILNVSIKQRCVE